MKNREIKFRFWDKDLKKMCYRKPAYNDFNHKNIIPLQFTGFKDFHGNDIYEGDIISIGKYSYVVVFEKGTFYLNHIKNDLGRWGLLSRCYEHDMKDLVTDLKVTDNIYKEPLKKWRKKIKEKIDKH